MSTSNPRCDQSELMGALALDAVPAEEAQALRAHIATCEDCQREMQALAPVVDSLVDWPTDVLRPSPSLRERLAQRIAQDSGRDPIVPPKQWSEPEWKEVAPGISCKLLATDLERDRVSMLVRLAPGTDYPPHRHAGFEELHLLHGELVINDSKFYPGDYYRAEAGTSDTRVRSDTGCTCVLVTSPSDELR